MNTVIKSVVATSLKATMLGVAALALIAGPAEAQRHGGGGGRAGASAFHGGGPGYYRGGGYYHGGGRGWGPGVFWGGLGLGLGVAAASSYYYNYPGYYGAAPVYYGPPVTVVDPAYVDQTPSGVIAGAPGVDPSAATSSPVQGNTGGNIGNNAGPAPAPIFYPRNGQSASQTERDRQDCNQWATSQQNAMNDANIFQRATLACMEGRGYTVR